MYIVYFKECLFRFLFLLISLFLIIILAYYFINDLITVISFPSKNLKLFLINPYEQLFFYFYIVSLFSFICFLPYLFIIVQDFFKTGLYLSEYKLYKLIFTRYVYGYIVLNIFIWLYLLPIFWKFFITFDKNFINVSFQFDITALNYLLYIFDLLAFINVLFAILFIFCNYFLFFKHYFIRLLHFKNYIIFIFIIVATIITPPDLIWQIYIFASLCICLEVLIFFHFYYKSIKQI